MNEFTIDALPNYQFRVGKISPIEYLTINTFVDFNNFEKTQKLFTFILEHIEVKIGETWTKVKEGNVYMPLQLETNMKAIEQLNFYFLNEILIPLFTESKE